MKIIRETGKRITSFSDLRIGDVFLFCEKSFIKICTYKIDTTDISINAVCLNDGEMYRFSVWDEIELVDAELIIKT